MFDYILQCFNSDVLSCVALVISFVAIGLVMYQRHVIMTKLYHNDIEETEDSLSQIESNNDVDDIQDTFVSTKQDIVVKEEAATTDTNFDRLEKEDNSPKTKVTEFTPRTKPKKKRPPTLRRRLRMTPAVSPATVVSKDVAPLDSDTKEDGVKTDNVCNPTT